MLSDQTSWDAWFQNIKSSVQDYLWEYSDPDGTAVFARPLAPIEPQREPTPETPEPAAGPVTRASTQTLAETPVQREARKAKHKEDLDLYFKRFNVYKDVKED